MDNASVSSLYYIALYDNYIALGKSTKTDKTDKKLNHLSFQSTEQLKNNTFLTWYRHFPRTGGIFIDWDTEGSFFV
jgi:hypothetical protein